jgi:hypothetical protein
MAAQLLCMPELEWIDFVAYDPRVIDPNGRLFCRRFQPPASYLHLVESEAIKFLREVDALFSLSLEMDRNATAYLERPNPAAAAPGVA